MDNMENSLFSALSHSSDFHILASCIWVSAYHANDMFIVEVRVFMLLAHALQPCNYFFDNGKCYQKLTNYKST